MNDVVRESGSSWIATQANTNAQPSTSPANWDKMADQGATGPAGAQGPAGPQGPQGPAGAQGTFSTANVTVRTAIMDGTLAIGTANCNAGEKALGGGYNLTTGGNIRPTADMPVVAAGIPTGWTVTFSQAVAGTLYVICVS